MQDPDYDCMDYEDLDFQSPPQPRPKRCIKRKREPEKVQVPSGRKYRKREIREEERKIKKMRSNHAKKVKERQRRSKMTDSIQQLRKTIPEIIHSQKKMNQSIVMEKAVVYIKQLQNQVAQLERQKSTLMMKASQNESNTSKRCDHCLVSPTSKEKDVKCDQIITNFTNACEIRSQSDSESSSMHDHPMMDVMMNKDSTAELPAPLVRLSGGVIEPVPYLMPETTAEKEMDASLAAPDPYLHQEPPITPAFNESAFGSIFKNFSDELQSDAKIHYPVWESDACGTNYSLDTPEYPSFSSENIYADFCPL